MKSPNFQLSADTRFLVQELEKAAVGDTIEYSALSAAISKTVDGSTAALRSARHALLRDKQMVFDTIPTVGLKRLSDKEIVGTSERTAKKIRNAAKNGVRVLTSVQNFSGLSRDEQMRHSAAVSIFGAVAEMTRRPQIEKIEKAIDPTKKELPFAATLEAFRK